MKANKLINQYVTAHADNRWMDASELEALLTEFAEKLKEPVSEDLERAAEECVDGEDYPYTDGEGMPLYTSDYLEYMFRQGAQWQKEQMMKEAIDSQVKWCNHGYPDIHIEDLAVLDEVQLPKDKFKIGDKVKVIIIKE